jgi:hypothetical protein
LSAGAVLLVVAGAARLVECAGPKAVATDGHA